MVRFTIIAPVHNEAESLAEFVERVRTTLNGYCDPKAWELLLVDDASTDGTPGLIDDFALEDERIVALHHRTKSGQTGCFLSGFAAAKGEVVVTIDADLQVFPEDIVLLLERIASGYDLVNAVRVDRDDFPAIVLCSKLGSILLRYASGIGLTDFTSNFTAIKRSYLTGLPLVGNDHRYIIPIVKSRGLKKMTEVDVRHVRRKTGASQYRLRKFPKAIPEVLRVFLRVHRGFYR